MFAILRHAHMFIYDVCLQYCVMRTCLYMMYVCNIASCAHVYICMFAMLRHAHMYILGGSGYLAGTTTFSLNSAGANGGRFAASYIRGF